MMGPLQQLRAKKSEVAPGVFLLTFKDYKDMGKTFLRFQEHYESPHFRGKVFSLKEFKVWYAANYGKGKFSYYEDWAGFNVPSYVLKPFYDGQFKHLTQREKALLQVFRKTPEPFYVIGAVGNDVGTMDHELAHGLYYTNPEYRAKVLKVLGKFDYSELKAALIGHMYCEEVIPDEVNAYLATVERGDTFMGIELAPYAKHVKKLAKLFKEYRRV